MSDETTARPKLDDEAARAFLAKRDLVVDLARVFCVFLVVVIHLLMIGVGVDASGHIVASRPLEAQPWFASATWVGQIMPLFFVVGGFASLTAWRSLQRKGGDASDYRRGRLVRLAVPTLASFLFLAVALGVATAVGVDPVLLETIATGVGSPLWFIAAYLICQMAVPFMARLHGRAPFVTLLVLLGGAVLTDAVRYASGITELGLANLVFVWFFAQQLGFYYADGWFRSCSRWSLVGYIASGYLGVWALVAFGPYSPDMLTNLNPPTLPLVLLAIAQVSALTLLHPLLARLMQWRPMQATVFVFGSRAMTVYLWHLPVILAVAGVSLVLPFAVPSPGSEGWWATRPLVLLLVLALVFVLAAPLSRLERPSMGIPDGMRRPGPIATWCAAALAIIPPFLVMQLFLDLPIALGGSLMLAAAVLLLRPRRFSSPRPVQSA